MALFKMVKFSPLVLMKRKLQMMFPIPMSCTNFRVNTFLHWSLAVYYLQPNRRQLASTNHLAVD